MSQNTLPAEMNIKLVIAILIGSVVGTISGTLFGSYLAQRHTFNFPLEKRDLIELDCSGAPHIKESGDTVIIEGWRDEKRIVRIYDDGQTRDIDITGYICSIGTKIGK